MLRIVLRNPWIKVSAPCTNRPAEFKQPSRILKFNRNHPRCHVSNVLIADDDRDLVQSLSLRCRNLSLETSTAHDALDALIAIKNGAPDLVILDVDMPGGNGLSVCEMMATDPVWSKIPVIILTGRRDGETIRRCHEMCAYYIVKGADLWARVEPVLFELLDVDATSFQAKSSEATPVRRKPKYAKHQHVSDQRGWTDQNSNPAVIGDFLGFRNDRFILIRTADDELTVLEIASLSEADRDYIAHQMEKPIPTT